MNIPAFKNINEYRAQKIDDCIAEDRAEMEKAFQEVFDDTILSDVESFHFIFAAAWVPFKQELCDKMKKLGYEALLVNDDYYGEVLHVQFR